MNSHASGAELVKTTSVKISWSDGTSSKYNNVMKPFCSPNHKNSCHGKIVYLLNLNKFYSLQSQS